MNKLKYSTYVIEGFKFGKRKITISIQLNKLELLNLKSQLFIYNSINKTKVKVIKKGSE